MSALLLYATCGAGLLWLAHRFITPLSRAAALILWLLPFLIAGRALLTGGVLGPFDLAYEEEPLASMAGALGIEGVGNPMLTDVQRLMVPWRAAVRYALAHGDWPLWNPFMFSGDILAAASEPAPWHPFNLVSYLIPLGPSITFHGALTLLSAALAAFLLARELGASEPAAVVAAIGWMLSAFLLFFIQVPLGSTVLMLPLVIVAVRRVVDSPGFRSALLLTITLAFVVMSGHPESTLHVVAVGVVWGLFELTRAWVARGGRAVLPGAAWAVGAGMTTLAICAVHLLPLVMAMPDTADYAYRARNFVHESRSAPLPEALERLSATFVPFVFGSPQFELAHVPPHYYNAPMYGYAGSLLFAPAIVALLRWRDPTRWFLAALGVIGFLAGVATPGITHALQVLPLFDIALNERLVFAGVLALVMLAALGVESWIGGAQQPMAYAALATLAALTLGVVLLWPAMTTGGLTAAYLHTGTARLLIPLALFVTLVLIRINTALSATRAASLFAMLLIGQRLLEHGSMIPTIPLGAFYPVPALVAVLPKSTEPYRVVGTEMNLIPNTAAHYEVEDPRGFHGLTHGRLDQTLAVWSERVPVSGNVVHDLARPFLSFLNVRFAIDTLDKPIPAGWIERRRAGSARLLENLHALPRAFIPRDVVRGNGGIVITLMGVATDFAARAWIGPRLDDPDQPAPPLDDRNGTGHVTTKREGTRLHLSVTMDDPGWVVISETAWRGWRATIDGRPAPLHIANHAFLALHVPAGTHRVELTYMPRSFVIGAAISAAAIACVLLFGLWPRRRRT